MSLTIMAGLLSGCVSTRESDSTDTDGSGAEATGGVVNVYNWGEYIDESVLTDFEEATGIKVNYQMYDSNETMYSKVAAGGAEYDVVIPSDYMIARMIEEDMLEPLNFDNIPNFADIDPNLLNPAYDPENLYSVPYMWGLLGVIYNKTMVDEADLGSWDLMWNEKYSGKILQFNNSRDAFGTAMYRLGIDVNTTDTAQWDQALDSLLEQRPLVNSYVMDEIFNKLESGEAAIGAYYAGDYFTMVDAQADNVDLQFYYPEPTNYFVDAMCIPTGCQNQELAEIFINYMLSEEAAVANAEYIYYASPNSLVYDNETYQEDMGEEAMAILYPEGEDFATAYNQLAYRNLSNDMLDYVNTLWENLKIN